jgi:hypothetical protein
MSTTEPFLNRSAKTTVAAETSHSPYIQGRPVPKEIRDAESRFIADNLKRQPKRTRKTIP